MSNFHIYTTYYKDQNETRDTELKATLILNMRLPHNSFNVFIEDSDADQINKEILDLAGSEIKINVIKKQARPSFNDVFEQIALDSKDAEESDVFIFMNTDIYLFDLSKFVKIRDGKIAYAISRYDYRKDLPVELRAKLFERPDSQDTWVFFGKTQVKLPLLINFGVAGCDNRLAYEIEQQGYELINPAYRIITLHFHDSGIRNYINSSGDVVERIPPPYKLVPLS